MFPGQDGSKHQGAGEADLTRRSKWMPHMMHFLSNESITVAPGDAATGRWYSWEAATVLIDGDHVAIWIAGRYDMKFVNQDGSWRILEMHFQEIFSTPFDSAGWTEIPHVDYGPGQLSH
jgi:hypothetical protein